MSFSLHTDSDCSEHILTDRNGENESNSSSFTKNNETEDYDRFSPVSMNLEVCKMKNYYKEVFSEYRNFSRVLLNSTEILTTKKCKNATVTSFDYPVNTSTGDNYKTLSKNKQLSKSLSVLRNLKSLQNSSTSILQKNIQAIELAEKERVVLKSKLSDLTSKLAELSLTENSTQCRCTIS